MRVLAGIPPLHSYESPASWLTRAALSQGVRVEELMVYLGLPVNRDPDLTMKGSVLSKAAALAGHPSASFSFATHMFSGLEDIDPTGENLLLWTKDRKPRYRFCPLCLHEPGVKYFPLHWRFQAWRWCPIHDCLMSDHCPHCNSEVSLPESMIFSGYKRAGVAYLDRCLQCAEKLDDGCESIPHPFKEGLTADWERSLLENGRAVLAAIFQRHFVMSRNNKRYSLDKLIKFKKMGILPYDLLDISSQTLKLRREMRNAPLRNHPGFLAEIK